MSKDIDSIESAHFSDVLRRFLEALISIGRTMHIHAGPQSTAG
jgi:hypothetical protein